MRLGRTVGSPLKLRLCSPQAQLRSRHYSSYSAAPISRTSVLESWDLRTFQRLAFDPGAPHILPFDDRKLPAASKLWFVHNDNCNLDRLDHGNGPSVSELKADFWQAFGDTVVPLELTTSDEEQGGKVKFRRSMAPLALMLDFLALPASDPARSGFKPSVYLAQCPLPSLPAALQQAVATPDLVKHAGRGDIYDSSLWLGHAPTYTPLHRDPNPNLFIQLAGRKVVRLLPPEMGDFIFDRVQEVCHGDAASKNIRGEEMMVGSERHLLEAAVWGGENKAQQDDTSELYHAVLRYGQEAELSIGEALFIPKGWWHSVRGVGEGVTASVNWWFR